MKHHRFALAALVLASGIAAKGQTPESLLFALRRWIGTPAPELAYVDPVDASAHRLSEHLGKVVLLCFWNRSCQPCVDEMPELGRLTEKFDEAGFVLIHVSPDDAETQSRFINSHEVEGVFGVVDAGGLRSPFQAVAYPMHVLIDGNGVIRDGWFGAIGVEQMEQRLKLLIPGKGALASLLGNFFMVGGILLAAGLVVFVIMHRKLAGGG